jgi:hypothetical protein
MPGPPLRSGVSPEEVADGNATPEWVSARPRAAWREGTALGVWTGQSGSGDTSRARGRRCLRAPVWLGRRTRS